MKRENSYRVTVQDMVNRAMKSSSRFPLDSDLIGWEGAVGGVCLRHGWWAAVSSSGEGEAGTPATSETELEKKKKKKNIRVQTLQRCAARAVTEQRTWQSRQIKRHVRLQTKYWYNGIVWKETSRRLKTCNRISNKMLPMKISDESVQHYTMVKVKTF